jgi:hypothetical protein
VCIAISGNRLRGHLGNYLLRAAVSTSNEAEARVVVVLVVVKFAGADAVMIAASWQGDEASEVKKGKAKESEKPAASARQRRGPNSDSAKKEKKRTEKGRSAPSE